MNAIPEFNEVDQGTQVGMFETDKEIIIKGKGRITQISIDDTLKLENIKEKEMKKSIVQTVTIDSLVIGTEYPERFIEELERLCVVFASVIDASNGDGYTFKFNVES